METPLELLDVYKPLFINPPDNRYFLVTGSRGSGKSYVINLFLLNLTYEEGHVILFTRYTLVSAFISIIPEFVDKIELLGKQDDFDVTQSEIINKRTGSKILFRGIKTSSGINTANLKSIANVTTFVIEEAEELVDEEVFDRIDLSVRDKSHPNRVIMIMNPSYKSHWIYKRFVKNPDKLYCNHIHTTYLDNVHNLSESFIQAAERTKQENLLRYEHLFLGKWLEDAEGLLWNRSIIDRARIDIKPQFARVVVSVDPAATANSESDETGITVLGKDIAGNGYLIEDLSGKYSPNEWGKVVSQAVKNHNADCVVAEKNQGGDMVEAVIRQHDKTTRIKLVTATKGKYVRAEPIYSLYEANKIFHIGNFPILETQMVTFDPDKGKSPDRVDALVWGFTDLMLGIQGNYTGKTHGKTKRDTGKSLYQDIL
jgi:PBSX family phage terminase large subunit